jgi:hypothetical protein
MCVPQFPASARRAILTGFSRKRPGKVVAARQQPDPRPGNGCGGSAESAEATGPQGPQPHPPRETAERAVPRDAGAVTPCNRAQRRRWPGRANQKLPMKTFSAKPAEVKHEWYVIDATDKVL